MAEPPSVAGSTQGTRIVGREQPGFAAPAALPDSKRCNTAPGSESTGVTIKTTAGRRLACPTLVLRATEDDMEDLYGDVPGV